MIEDVSVKVTRQEWKKHWQVDTPEQLMFDKPLENPALHELEEALPPMKAEELQRAACSSKEVCSRWLPS